MDIVIYTRESVLNHKKFDEELMYWSLRFRPVKLNVGDRIYFASDNKVQGSFEVHTIDTATNGRTEVEFFTATWKEIGTDIPAKHNQGFSYRWW